MIQKNIIINRLKFRNYSCIPSYMNNSEPVSFSKFDSLIMEIPLIGKILCSLFGLFEVALLEFIRRTEKHFKISLFHMISNHVLRKTWGSRVIPLKKNISHKLKFSPTQEIKEIVKRSDVTGISWCYCRSSQRKDNIPKCDHPLYTCIHLASGTYLREIPFKSLK